MFPRILLVSAFLLTGLAHGQERKTRIDVERYTMDVDINQRTQTLAAKVAVRFIPLDDNTTSATFELNNALNVSKVVDQQDHQLQASRSQQREIRRPTAVAVRRWRRRSERWRKLQQRCTRLGA